MNQAEIAYYRRGVLLKYIPVTWDIALDNFQDEDAVKAFVAANTETVATVQEASDARQAKAR